MKNRGDFFRKYGIIAVLAALIVCFALLTPKFLTVSNIMNIGRQVSMMGIASVGMMFVMLTGGIDLSIGSALSFINIICAYFMMNMGMNPVVACIVCVLIATLCGYTNGLLITKLKIPPLIATLAMMNILSGLAYIISGGMPIYGFPEWFSTLGQGYVGVIPIPVIIMIAIFAVGAVILYKTYFGRYFYAIGGNEEASKLSGINVVRIKQLVYSLSGLFAGLASIIMLSRLNSGQPSTGNGFEFEVITAVVLGGVSVAGGSGKISGVIVGVLIMGILSNGLILINISEYVQLVIEGCVLIAAVGFDCLSKSRNEIREKANKEVTVAKALQK